MTTKRLEEVCDVRTFQAVLFDFYPVTIQNKDGAVIGEKILDAGMIEYLQKRHGETTPFLFRVEVKGMKDIGEKNRLARDLSNIWKNTAREDLLMNRLFMRLRFGLSLEIKEAGYF